MDGAAEGRRWPETREALSLARLGLRVRMGDTAADGAPVDTRIGATARAVAITGTVVLAILGVMQLAVIMNTVRGNPAVHFEWAHPFTITFLNHQDYSIAYCDVLACWLVVPALIGAMAVAAVGCAVGYRSVAWSVAFAVVTVAAAGPVMAWLAVDPGLGAPDLGLMLGLSCVLMVVAGLAVARERRAARREQPAAVSSQVS